MIEPFRYIAIVSIQRRTFPNGCKVAKIRPLFTKEEASEVCNYHLLLLFPGFSKFILKAIFNQYIDYFEENNILSWRQFGYQKKILIKLTLIYFTNNCIDADEAVETVMACFANLS